MTSGGPPQALASAVADADAAVVARLRRAGAVIVGKTNVPAMCLDVQARPPAPWSSGASSILTSSRTVKLAVKAAAKSFRGPPV